MKYCRNKLANLKIKWKLTLGVTSLLIVLFLTYNIFQFLVMNNWVIRHEQQTIQNNMKEVMAYFQDKQENLSTDLIQNSSSFLTKANEKHQMIRILDNNKNILLSVTNEVPVHWIKPETVTMEQVELMKHGEDRLLIIRSPITDAQFVGTVEIVKNLETFDQLIDQLLIVMIAIGIGAVILSFFGGIIASKQLLSPVRDISNSVERIKKLGLKERVQVNETHDEISELAMHFNELMDQIEKAFAKQRQFVEDASHELRTPLQVIKGHLSMVDRWGKDDPEVLNKSLKSSLREVDRLTRLVKDLLDLSRLDSDYYEQYEIEKIEVVPLIEDTIQNFQMVNPDFEFVFEHEDITKRQLLIQKNQLEQLLIILMDNAIKYSSDQKKIEVYVSISNDQFNIKVKDYGIGISADELTNVFDRFYRTDKSRTRKKGGYGIGLSIAKRIIEKYHGSINIKSELNKGTSVIVQIPLED